MARDTCGEQKSCVGHRRGSQRSRRSLASKLHQNSHSLNASLCSAMHARRASIRQVPEVLAHSYPRLKHCPCPSQRCCLSTSAQVLFDQCVANSSCALERALNSAFWPRDGRHIKTDIWRPSRSRTSWVIGLPQAPSHPNHLCSSTLKPCRRQAMWGPGTPQQHQSNLGNTWWRRCCAHSTLCASAACTE